MVVVAVGVIRRASGEILIAKRAEHLHQGGLWEFPGGKVEADETVSDALVRELYEELGIQVISASPFMVIEHQYSDKRVKLDVWLVTEFEGNALGREQQPIEWVNPQQLIQFDFPDANKPILERIKVF